MAETYIDEVKHEKERVGKKDASDSGKPTVFRHLISSDLPRSELSTSRLSQEAQVLFGAGTPTTARALLIITFYALSNLVILERLREDLQDVMADYPIEVPKWSQLEKLPYLQAVIKEGLR